MWKCRLTVVLLFQAKVVIAEQTEKDIDETRSQYIPVAVRTQILFFCTYELVRNLWNALGEYQAFIGMHDLSDLFTLAKLPCQLIWKRCS